MHLGLLPTVPASFADEGFARREHTVQCRNCGLVQLVQGGGGPQLMSCRRCGTQLEHGAGRSFDATLACALAVMLLLIPSWCLPFLTTSALDATLTSTLPMSVSVLWGESRPWLAIVVFLFVLLAPAVRFGAMSAALAALRLGLRPPWVAPAFRLCNALQTWAMLDVFLLGFVVAYVRLRDSLLVTIGPGALCFIAAALLSLVARATLDRARIWRMIAPDCEAGDKQAALACRSCELLVPGCLEGGACPRCAATLHARKPASYSRSMALLSAAVLLYVPANVYPIATIPIGLTPTPYTVLGGVADLLQSHLFGLAALIFAASFIIPLLKMAGLSWCAASVIRHSTRHLVGKTRIYRVIEEIGRWSLVDPLTIACFVPVLRFNGLIYGRADAAAIPFAAVAILTTLAVRAFDPRLMWSEARCR